MPSVVEEQFQGWFLDSVVLPDARVRQGDLIRFDGEANPIRKLAIVVTADCDLEQKKHARTLTLVPVVDAHIILEQYLIPDDCEKKRSLIEQFAFKECSIPVEHDIPTKYAFLRERQVANSSDLHTAVATAISFLVHNTTAVSLMQYNDLMSAMKLAPRKVDVFKNQLRSRGDLLILPEAPGLGIRGHVAWVRQLWQTSASEVALRTSEIGGRSGERIARLDSPFRYRLTQLIAQVFSDIGLPNFPDSIDHVLDEAYR